MTEEVKPKKRKSNRPPVKYPKKSEAMKGNQNAIGNIGGGVTYWTEERINEEAEHLVKWAMKEDSLSLGICYANRLYSYHDALEWEQKSSVFRQAKRLATTMLTARREHGGLIGKLDSAIVRSTHGTYDLEHRAYLKEMKEAAKDPINEEDKGIFKEMMAKYMALATSVEISHSTLSSAENNNNAETKS